MSGYIEQPDSTGYVRKYEAPSGAIYYLMPSAEGVSDQRWITEASEAVQLERDCPERLLRVR